LTIGDDFFGGKVFLSKGIDGRPVLIGNSKVKKVYCQAGKPDLRNECAIIDTQGCLDYTYFSIKQLFCSGYKNIKYQFK
jgi:hypothetical protein